MDVNSFVSFRPRHARRSSSLYHLASLTVDVSFYRSFSHISDLQGMHTKGLPHALPSPPTRPLPLTFVCQCVRRGLDSPKALERLRPNARARVLARQPSFRPSLGEKGKSLFGLLRISFTHITLSAYADFFKLLKMKFILSVFKDDS